MCKASRLIGGALRDGATPEAVGTAAVFYLDQAHHVGATVGRVA